MLRPPSSLIKHPQAATSRCGKLLPFIYADVFAYCHVNITFSQAMDLCKTILTTLQNAGLISGGGGGAPAAAESDGPKLLATAVVMADQPEVVDIMAEPEQEVKEFKMLGVDGMRNSTHVQ